MLLTLLLLSLLRRGPPTVTALLTEAAGSATIGAVLGTATLAANAEEATGVSGLAGCTAALQLHCAPIVGFYEAD